MLVHETTTPARQYLTTAHIVMPLYPPMRRLLVLPLIVVAAVSAWSASTGISFRRPARLFTLSSEGTYDLGIGKNKPISGEPSPRSTEEAASNWIVPSPANRPPKVPEQQERVVGGDTQLISIADSNIKTQKKILARDEKTKHLTAAVWHASHFEGHSNSNSESAESYPPYATKGAPSPPDLIYPKIDLSIPATIYSAEADVVWDTLRYEAFQEAEREPLLVSFLHSTILNHKTLESSLAFHLANRLSSPAMMSTQVQALIQEALDNSPEFRRSLRADIMAVRDRDPACTCLPDVFLYFKGFHALQTHRVAHYMYKGGRQVLAHYLQSQVSQNFQIDIHPNATLGRGIMLDHGTGIVIGETATVGHNCSILHHVTLGGSGKKGVDRHPKVGNGVLLGAGCSVLGNVVIGEGCQVGAGTLVIGDLPPHSVAVGVPAKIIGSFVDVTEQPSLSMNQMTGTVDFDKNIVTFESAGI